MPVIDGKHLDQWVHHGNTIKIVDGQTVDTLFYGISEDLYETSRAATPIDYIWVADGIYKWELPIFNLNDVGTNTLRIYTGSTTGCFNLVSTSDSSSSNLRFYDGTSIKCFQATDSIQYDFPPTIDSFYCSPTKPSDVNSIRFYAIVSDNEGEVVSANLLWTKSAWVTEFIISMTFGSTWVANLAAQPGGTTVEYKVVAWDDKWQPTTSSISAFTVITSKPK